MKRASNFLDLTGYRYGRLTALRFSRVDSKKRTLWVCRCDCGTVREFVASYMRNGETSSCGCFRKENSGDQARTHGMSNSPEWSSWRSMLNRCYWPKEKSYWRYGGKGTTVCKRWRTSFENFYADMGLKPSPQHTIDRINGKKNYTPFNCRWATPKEQARNKENSVVIDGKHLADIYEEKQRPVRYKVVSARLRRGWKLKDALSFPPVKGKKYRG